MIFQFILDSGIPSLAATSDEGTSATTIIIVILSAIVFITLAIAFHRLLRALRRPEMMGLDRKKVLELWTEINKTAEQGLMGAKLAVIEADKLVDGAMRSMMIPGETMGERLKAAQYKYPNIQKVWPAHKLRNQLAHDPTFQISIRHAKNALADFEAALKVLNVM